jgi:phosphopantothenoylcysteine synthetase/decarboxylase
MGAGAMPIDLRKALRAAVEAALEDPTPDVTKKPRLSTGRALLVGAGLMAAGRLALGHRGQNMLESLQQRLAENGGHGDEVEDEDQVEGEDEDEVEGDDDDEVEVEDEDADEVQAESEDDFEEEEDEEYEPEPAKGRGRAG